MLARPQNSAFGVLSVFSKRNQKYANLNRRGFQIKTELQQNISVEEYNSRNKEFLKEYF